MVRATWLVVCVLVCWVCLSCGQDDGDCALPDGVKAPKEVIIGGLMGTFSFVAEKSAAIVFAVDLINEDKCLLPETRLNLILREHSGVTEGLKEFLDVQEEFNPVGWTGFPLSSVSRTIAVASPLSETPIISGTSTLADLSDQDKYPYFSRVIASTADQGIILAEVCNEYGWDRVATISVSDPFGASMVEQFTNTAIKYSINFLSSATYPLNDAADYEDQIRAAIRKTKASGARIILLATIPGQNEYWRIALEEGFLGPPYTYLLPEGFRPEEISNGFNDDELSKKFKQSLQGIITVQTQGVQSGPVTDDWVEAWMAADPDRYPGAGQEQFATNKALALYRDATYVLAHAIDRLIRRGIDPSDGEALLDTIQTETDFVGLTGDIRLKRTGDRFATHDILNIQDSSFELKKIGWANEDKLVIKKKAIFSDGTTRIPDAAERIYVHWDDVEAVLMLTLFSLGTIVTLVCLVVMMIHRSSPIMNYSSPRFVFGTAVGVMIGFANVFVWTGEPCSATCQARPWLLVLNFVFIFGHMYAKAFRFLYVMKKRKTLQFRPIPDIQLFLCVLIYLLVFAIPVVVWTAAFPLDVTRSDNNPDNDKVNIICDGENAEVFWALLLGLGGVSLVVGVVVAFLNRNYHDFFSEATYIGYTMFTVCVTCCVVLPMLFILSDTPHAFYIVLMLGIFLGNGAVLVFMFFPKIWVIAHPDKNQVPLNNSGGLKTKKSSSGSII